MLLATAVVSCGGDSPDPARFEVEPGQSENAIEQRAPCTHRDPQGMALFGDLHVHTSLSSDARNYDLRVRPHEAYGYAFGREIALPPNDAYGRGTRRVRLDRPLDFAAVTDHAEFLGENLLCTTPDSEVYETETCASIRHSESPIDSPLVLKIMNPFSSRDAEVCGVRDERCAEMTDVAWREISNAAEAWNDTSEACERTTFIGYEYSSHRLGSNLHRNVIFRNSRVPRSPISFMDVRRVWQLWELLRETCLESDTGCDVLAIPHNSNISNGRMFSIDYPGASSLEAQAARHKREKGPAR